MKLVQGASAILALTLNGIFLHYVYTLEKDQCECSFDWKRDYIKYYTIIMFAVTLLAIVAPYLKNTNVNNFLGLLASILGLAGLVNLWCLYSYSKKLKDENCECSDNWQRKFIYTYSVVIGILWIFAFLLTILLMPQIVVINKNCLEKK